MNYWFKGLFLIAEYKYGVLILKDGELVTKPIDNIDQVNSGDGGSVILNGLLFIADDVFDYNHWILELSGKSAVHSLLGKDYRIVDDLFNLNFSETWDDSLNVNTWSYNGVSYTTERICHGEFGSEFYFYVTRFTKECSSYVIILGYDVDLPDSNFKKETTRSVLVEQLNKYVKEG